MADEPKTRSVKIPEDERMGWSSERPRRDGAPPRPPDLTVRCRVLSPSDHLRYSPGSLLVIVSVSAAERNRFAERLIDGRMLFSLDKVRGLLEGRVPEDQIDDRAKEILSHLENPNGVTTELKPKRKRSTSARPTTDKPQLDLL